VASLQHPDLGFERVPQLIDRQGVCLSVWEKSFLLLWEADLNFRRGAGVGLREGRGPHWEDLGLIFRRGTGLGFQCGPELFGRRVSHLEDDHLVCHRGPWILVRYLQATETG